MPNWYSGRRDSDVSDVSEWDDYRRGRSRHATESEINISPPSTRASSPIRHRPAHQDAFPRDRHRDAYGSRRELLHYDDRIDYNFPAAIGAGFPLEASRSSRSYESSPPRRPQRDYRPYGEDYAQNRYGDDPRDGHLPPRRAQTSYDGRQRGYEPPYSPYRPEYGQRGYASNPRSGSLAPSRANTSYESRQNPAHARDRGYTQSHSRPFNDRPRDSRGYVADQLPQRHLPRAATGSSRGREYSRHAEAYGTTHRSGTRPRQGSGSRNGYQRTRDRVRDLLRRLLT